MTAGLAAGAAGVWIGTAWLLSKEHQAHRHPVDTEKLQAAESGDAVITRSESGKTFRQVRSAWSQEWASEDAPTRLKMSCQDVLVGDPLGAIAEHAIEPLINSGAGQSIGYFNEVKTVKVIIDDLVKEGSEVQGLQASFKKKGLEADIFK